MPGLKNYKKWVIILTVCLVTLFPLFPLPFDIQSGGHPWKSELVFFAFAFPFLVFLWLKKIHVEIADSLVYIRIFITLFMGWGATSVFWAEAGGSVFQHTAVWFAYLLTFYAASWIAPDATGRRILLQALIASTTETGVRITSISLYLL